jgi:hypothetical protein
MSESQSTVFFSYLSHVGKNQKNASMCDSMSIESIETYNFLHEYRYQPRLDNTDNIFFDEHQTDVVACRIVAKKQNRNDTFHMQDRQSYAEHLNPEQNTCTSHKIWNGMDTSEKCDVPEHYDDRQTHSPDRYAVDTCPLTWVKNPFHTRWMMGLVLSHTVHDMWDTWLCPSDCAADGLIVRIEWRRQNTGAALMNTLDSDGLTSHTENTVIVLEQYMSPCILDTATSVDKKKKITTRKEWKKYQSSSLSWHFFLS